MISVIALQTRNSFVLSIIVIFLDSKLLDYKEQMRLETPYSFDQSEIMKKIGGILLKKMIPTASLFEGINLCYIQTSQNFFRTYDQL